MNTTKFEHASINDYQLSVIGSHTQCYTVSVYIDPDAQEGGKAYGKKQVEARYPTSDDCSFLETLLCKLTGIDSQVS